MAHTRQRIHHQQHVFTFIAEILGDRRRHLSGADAEQRSVVAGRRNDDALAQARLAESILKKFLHLASALTDERDYRDISAGVSRNARDQRALAHARPREDAHPLALTAGEQAVDSADTGGDRLPNRLAMQRSDASAIDAAGFRCRDAALAVDGLAEAVEHSTEEIVAAPDARSGGDIFDAVAARHAHRRRERHEQRALALETDYFCQAA